MKELSEMYTPAEVEKLIDEIERGYLGLRDRAASKHWSPEERAADIKLNAMCNALERLAELQAEIDSGLRAKNGELNIRV